MCGILGIFYKTTERACQDKFKAALELMRHRGPNDIGISEHTLTKKSIVFGQTRLSVIDLTKGGHQPFHSIDGRYTLIFNGEIYNYLELKAELLTHNYIFYTSSDTEVLLHAWLHWGEDCLKKLVGMFAFAIYDSHEESLSIARDAFGIKPLYIYDSENQFVFSSEVQSLIKLAEIKSIINQQRVYDYLIHGHYDDASDTFYENITHLKPAHILKIDLKTDSKTTLRWWWPSVIEDKSISFQQACEKFKKIFLKNIQLHMRSDVPIGIALSGGLDSSAVVCAARHLYPALKINTFTYVAKGTNLDEEKWADLVNEHVNAIPHKIIVTQDSLHEDLDQMLYHQGEPFGSTSIYAGYKVFESVKEADIVVTLDGQGADELLAGYRGYPGERLRSLIEQGKLIEAYNFLINWSKWPGRSIVFGIFTLLQALIPISWQLLPRKLAGKPAIPNWVDKAKLDKYAINPLSSLKSIIATDSVYGRRLPSTLRHVSLNGSLVALLRHGDRNSMRWSIESRVPFLTIEMAEFLFSLPEEYLISQNGETKHLLRSALRGIVPDIILDRKDKIGFATPEQGWLKTLNLNSNDFAYLRSVLGYIKPEIEQKIFKLLNFSGESNFQVWRIFNLIKWLKTNNIA